MSKIFNKIIILAFLFVILFTITGCKKKVKFNVNFYADNQIYEVVGTNGKEVIEMPVNPTKEGYTFEGWYWDDGTWLKPFTAQSLVQTPLKEDMNVYAYFLDEDAPRGTDLKFKDGVLVEHDGIGDTYLVIVSNSTIAFSFTNYVDVSNKSTWTVSTDVYGNNTITSKTVELEVGNNLYFVQVFDSETNRVKQYNVAVRRRPIYTVYFDTNGGTSCSMQRVEEDSLVAEPTTSKTGYTFAGWDYNFNTPLKSDLVINASWTPNQYSITFDANGGYLSNNKLTVTYDKTYSLPTPTKTGYKFNGWYENNNKVSDGIWRNTSNITLVAKWAVNTYNINYNLNSGTISSTKPSSYTYGTTKTIPNPSKIGYEFIGWTINNSTQKYKDYQISDTTYGDLELVANYKPNVYTVTLDSNGGDCEIDLLTVTYNESYALPLPTKTGYKFEGWFNGSSKLESGVWSKTSSLDLKAKWSIVNYTITYDLNDGINNENNPSTYTFESNTITLLDASKIGYTFIGWTSSNITVPTKNILIEKGSTGDIKFIANFKANTYQVIFDVNGGNELEDNKFDVIYDSDYILPKPEKIGYEFKGWYNEVNELVSDGLWNIDSDVNLKAKWEIKTFKINYILNGGVNSNDNLQSYNYEYNDVTILNPSKTGYTFNGWIVNGNSELVKDYVIKHNSLGDVSLEAIFTANIYKLTLDVNGGDNLDNSEFEISYDEKVTLEEVSRIGYNFDGWYNGTNKVEDGTWKYLEDVTLVAKWTLINYSISYNLDGGKNSGYNSTKYNYEYQDITITNPTKTGYTFIGWSINNSEKLFVDYVIKQYSYGNLVLKANWKVNEYRLSLDVNGGNVFDEKEFIIEYGSTYSLPAPTRIGYTFDGWYNGTSKVEGGVWKYLDDVTLVAKWNAINYNITYYLNGATINNNPLTYTYDDESIVLSDPYREGHTFIGWITDTVFIPTKNLEIPHNSTGEFVFEAVFEANTYTIEFDVNGGSQLSINKMEVVFGEYVELEISYFGAYQFLGWYYGDLKVESGEWNIDDNVILIAKWTLNSYIENGKTYVNLGKYPQTIVSDSIIIANLNKINITNELGYLEYNGEEYAKVICNPYWDNHIPFSDGSKAVKNEIRYFKVEPIKWRVIATENNMATLICEYVIESQIFDEKSCNYELSNIRNWLNNDFYNKTFNDDEKYILQKMFVDNSYSSIDYSFDTLKQYESNDTYDFVKLLSNKEFRVYNLSSNSKEGGYGGKLDEAIKITDYSIAVGLAAWGNNYEYASFVWTRSPGSISNSGVQTVYLTWGLDIKQTRGSVDSRSGVLPCISITTII